jgi:ribosomal protein L37E
VVGIYSARSNVHVLDYRALWCVNLTGTQWNSVKGIKATVITFQASEHTYMDPHGVPSTGDWALEHVAAAFLQSTKNVEFEGCLFDGVDVNEDSWSQDTTAMPPFGTQSFPSIGGTAILRLRDIQMKTCSKLRSTTFLRRLAFGSNSKNIHAMVCGENIFYFSELMCAFCGTCKSTIHLSPSWSECIQACVWY